MISFLVLLTLAVSAQTYDTVILGARALDPESKLDAIRNIGIRDGRIAAIATTPMSGKRVIEAKGLAAAPGFIDMHAHGQELENQRYQVRDGVTTALELEIGTLDIDAWYAQREGKRLIHSGATVGHAPARIKVFKDPSQGFVPHGDGARKPASEEQITLLRQVIEKGLLRGGLGLGFGIQYTPAASRWEIMEAFRVAGRMKAPVFVHMRHMGDAEPDAMNSLEEVIAAATVTKAPLHVVHITSSGLAQTPKLLQTIREARAAGLDITTECYPYTAAMTELESAMFDPGWQKVLGVDYGAIEWVATGERLNAQTFAQRRKQGGMVIMHMIPEKAADAAIADPSVIIASDGIIKDGKGHPRGAGTYARVLGHYVRERKILSLMDAVAKMSLLPAKRLEVYAPQMKQKGRLKVGADADIVLFDPDRVIDRATFREPTLASEGIPYVLVAGTVVVDNNKLNDAVRPGHAVRAEVKN